MSDHRHPESTAQQEATQPDSLVDQIEEAYRQDAGQPPARGDK